MFHNLAAATENDRLPHDFKLYFGTVSKTLLFDLRHDLGISHNYHHFHVCTKRTEGGRGSEGLYALKNVDNFQGH